MTKLRALARRLRRAARAAVDRIRLALPYLRYFEPARLQALKVALVALLATNGVTLAPQISTAADTGIRWIGIGVAAVAWLQGELTRRKVTSPASADRLRAATPPAETGPIDPIGPA